MALEREFQFYLDHQNELVAKFGGKFVVIKADAVLGAFDSEAVAVREASKIHELGTFLIQECEPGADAYTQTFHSRVVLSGC